MIKILLAGCGALCLLFIVAHPKGLRAPAGFPTNRQPYTCIQNLRILESAKATFALELGKTNGQPVTMSDLVPYLTGNETNCPAGGHYQVGNIGVDPTCSFGTNRVAWHRELFLYYTYLDDSGTMHRFPK
jgi:hypothetical protein